MRSLPLQAGVAAIVLALSIPSHSPKAEVAAEEGAAQEVERAVLAAEQQAAVPLVLGGCRYDRWCCGDWRCFSIRDDGQPGNGAFLCYWRNNGSRRRAAIWGNYGSR